MIVLISFTNIRTFLFFNNSGNSQSSSHLLWEKPSEYNIDIICNANGSCEFNTHTDECDSYAFLKCSNEGKIIIYTFRELTGIIFFIVNILCRLYMTSRQTTFKTFMPGGIFSPYTSNESIC